jgi:hypothetical protein
MDDYYQRIPGKPGLDDALKHLGDGIAARFKRGDATRAEVRRHPAGGLAVRLIAASVFVVALFALIGRAIELALVL